MTRGEKARYWLKRIFSFGLSAGAKAAKRPAVREALETAGDVLDESDILEDEPRTPAQTPSAKRQHRGLK